MSEVTDSKQSADSASRKRRLEPDGGSEVPSKYPKVRETLEEAGATSESCKNSEADGEKNSQEGGQSKESEGKPAEGLQGLQGSEDPCAPPVNNPKTSSPKASNAEKLQSSDAHGSAESKKNTQKTAGAKLGPSASLDQTDSAAIAAAEALASLTRGDGEDSRETPCSSEKAKPVKQGSKLKQRGSHHHQSSKTGSRTQAAAADSSTSVHSTDREDGDEMPGADEGDESMSGSSSTPSSSFPSDNEDNEDGECAIVSVKMAPEMRQSVALLAEVQMRLEALEKKNARLHQRLELKISRQRRPHLDQRRSITKTIPGFWVTALLNHPHLSAHIDETDEDALSYMTDLEIESFKNNKLGYRIRFHFRRNPYFQNNIIMKELHLGMGGSPMSFSNPILWHRGQNLTAHSEARKSSRGVYQTFFSWFSDHSTPGQDDVAQILKDDLYRDPLRYYLTPLWEPRENGSGGSSGGQAADNGNGDDCVVISDSDDEPGKEAGEEEPGHRKEEGEEEEEEDEEEEDEEEDEEEEEDKGRSADESPEEGEETGEIVIDGSDDSEQGEDEQA
ncbi:LOW QUALITY PROTEIN: testis-specific Y-encoded-like protein 1 [Pseudochaenichthys georgianus]|uniref:LOW QUALITY PROTEIN: testis-specific Y-encoded-like protein 1 n=1 Tax=Pseudochaenichthys georgianus TaxID=52239 RepID=UPI00146E90B5|nr:LOW QUALITY PROTEIN: testis specific protein Y-linked [Pseudochaenichthys georgianus]